MMAALAGVVKEDDKDIARKLFKAGDINKQVEEVSKPGLDGKKIIAVIATTFAVVKRKPEKL